MTQTPDSTTNTGAVEALKPCPFCSEPMTLAGGCNPYARCDTEGCWMHERKMAVPIDDSRQVMLFNARATPTPTSVEILGEKLAALSDRLQRIGALDSDNVQSAYEAVVKAFRAFSAPTPASEAEVAERCAKIADRISVECENDEFACDVDNEFGAAKAFGGKIEAKRIAAAIRAALSSVTQVKVAP